MFANHAEPRTQKISMPLNITGTSDASTLIHDLPQLIHTLLKYKWTDVEQKDFMSINKIVGRDVLLSCLNFVEEFKSHIDARKTHTERKISRKKEFYCLLPPKVNPQLINYRTTGRRFFFETLLLSGPVHPSSHSLFITPCRPQYISAG